VEQLAPFLFTVILDLFAEDFLGSRFVAIFIEFELTAALWAIDGPAGEDASDLSDVSLCIASLTPKVCSSISSRA